VDDSRSDSIFQAIPSDRTTAGEQGGNTWAKEKVGEHLKPNNVAPWEEVRDKLNQKLKGWKQYFKLGSPWQAFKVVDQHVEERVWQCDGAGLAVRLSLRRGRTVLRLEPAVYFQPFLHTVHEMVGAAAFFPEAVTAGLEDVQLYWNIGFAPGAEQIERALVSYRLIVRGNRDE
jgi:hypothetical protein